MSNGRPSVSDAEHREREWRFYLDDMMAFAQKVQSYTDGLEQTEFVADGRTYDATLRNLELIGEAATHIPDEVRTVLRGKSTSLTRKRSASIKRSPEPYIRPAIKPTTPSSRASTARVSSLVSTTGNRGGRLARVTLSSHGSSMPSTSR